ncbi:MAG TPA: hypothetical protein VHW92_08485 [Mycobacteriales bacterium]|nr:hypothetical protein [Mycobacteriales bacterium]
MSDELAPDPSPSRHRAPRVRIRVVVAVAVVIAVGLVAVGIGAGRSQRGAAPHARSPSRAAAPQPAAATPAAAIRVVLARRSRAILHHNRAALLATIDPTRRRFAARQGRMLANLRRVPLAAWSYTVATTRPRTGLRVPTYSARVSLHYRLRGFDSMPTDLTQYPTFTDRSGRWYLASLSDQAGRVSATELWDYGPVDVVRRPHVLVLGPPSMLGTMHQVADGLHDAIPRVTAVWGQRWPRRVVAEVPATQRELGEITGDRGGVAQLAALSSAEISSRPGRPAPVGDRVSVNPKLWPSLDTLGRQVVLTHELTHVASRADTGSQTPRWLQEGFADYVGFAGSGVPAGVIAAELGRGVRAGRRPRELPGDHRFVGSSTGLPQAYQEGWLACRLIAARAGQRGLVRFYRLVGTSTAGTGPAVDHAFHRILHLSTRQFTALWRTYVRQQLG